MTRLGTTTALLIAVGAICYGVLHYFARAPLRELWASFSKPNPLPGVQWDEWASSHAARKIDPRLKSMVSQVVTGWQQRGIASASFSVLRGYPKTQRPLGCTHYEKQHASGRAVDVAVGDLNKDGRSDLTDLCMFAESINEPLLRRPGACGVYGRKIKGVPMQWVHVDLSGQTDRWGEWQNADGTVTPVVWSSREAKLAARCRAWKLKPRRSNIKLIAAKQPSVLSFDDKTERVTLHPSLRLYVGNVLVKAYPTALGHDPINDKQKLGDYRTPEGSFYICGKNSKSRFDKSLHLSYPNNEDAERGLRSGLINRSTYNRIKAAIADRSVPPQETPLGGYIMLHGGGGARENWTWGCIALDTPDIVDLYNFVPIGTPIQVLPVKRKQLNGI